MPPNSKKQVTADDVKQYLHRRLPEALSWLFPAGKVDRKTFKIGNVRGDKGDSLVVELSGNKVGLWHDFATGEGGDIVSLWGAAHGWDSRRQFPDIIRSVQEWLGLSALPKPVIQASPQASQKRVSPPQGEPTGQWTYEDINRNHLAYVYRYDTPDGKEFLPWDVKAQKWQAPCPRPLYNQPGIARCDTVILVEGEKCAEALIRLDICATTAMNGACAPVDKTDWSPLQGKHVIIWPDHDIPGKGYANRVIPRLQALGVSLSLLDIPEDKPEKWDAANAVAEGMDVRAFMESCAHVVPLLSEDKIRVVEESPMMEPLPLRKKRDKARNFPVEALGHLLGGAALDIYDKIRAPLAVCAQSVLANAALVSQAHIDIKLPFGHISPVSLYLVSIGESGSRKSACDREASAFIRKREKELRQKHDQELASYINAKDAYDALRRKVLHDKSCPGQQDLEQALRALGAQPTPPLDCLLTVPEPTYEGICGYFMKGQPSIGLFSDEGGQFISGHGMNADHKIKTAAGLSSLWEGEPVKRMRGGDGTVILPGKRLSMHLMVQPGIVEKLLADPELLQQGLLSRLLAVYPPHLFGTRLSTSKRHRDGNALRDFNDRMLQIVHKELPMNPESERNELAPRVLDMTPEAKAAFYTFSDRIEVRLKDGCDLEGIRGFCSKLAEQACRIGAVIAFSEDPDILYLQGHHVERGAILAEYYALEALRLLGNASIPSYILEAESLLEWLKDVWPSKTACPDLISLPDVCRLGPHKIRRKEPAMNALKTLEDHGWLVKEKNGAAMNGKYRKDVWHIRRDFFDVEKQGEALTIATDFSAEKRGERDDASRTLATHPADENRTEGDVIPPTIVPDSTDEQWEGMNI